MKQLMIDNVVVAEIPDEVANAMLAVATEMGAGNVVGDPLLTLEQPKYNYFTERQLVKRTTVSTTHIDLRILFQSESLPRLLAAVD